MSTQMEESISEEEEMPNPTPSTPRWKDYDVIRCAFCDSPMKVLHVEKSHICESCGEVNSFEEVAEEGDDTVDDDDSPDPQYNYTDGTKVLKPGDILMTYCNRHCYDPRRPATHEHPTATEHVWTGWELKCLLCWPSKRPTGGVIGEYLLILFIVAVIIAILWTFFIDDVDKILCTVIYICP